MTIITGLNQKADRAYDQFETELAFLSKYPNVRDADGYNALQRLSHVAQHVARRFSDLAARAMNEADAHAPDTFFPQKHREELEAEVRLGEYVD
jgi:hypothetical protein